MNQDMTVQCDNGLINIRVGAIILKDGKLLNGCFFINGQTEWLLPCNRRFLLIFRTIGKI